MPSTTQHLESRAPGPKHESQLTGLEASCFPSDGGFRLELEVAAGRILTAGDLGPSRSVCGGRSDLGTGLEGPCFVLPLALASLLAFRVEGLMIGKFMGETRFLAEDGCELLAVAGLDDFGS